MAVNPIRGASVVKHAVNTSLAVLDVVVDRIRESAGQSTIETKSFVVDTGVKGKRFNFSIKSVAKVVAQARLLAFIEPIAVTHVVMRRILNPNAHELPRTGDA